MVTKWVKISMYVPIEVLEVVSYRHKTDLTDIGWTHISEEWCRTTNFHGLNTFQTHKLTEDSHKLTNISMQQA